MRWEVITLPSARLWEVRIANGRGLASRRLRAILLCVLLPSERVHLRPRGANKSDGCWIHQVRSAEIAMTMCWPGPKRPERRSLPARPILLLTLDVVACSYRSPVRCEFQLADHRVVT